MDIYSLKGLARFHFKNNAAVLLNSFIVLFSFVATWNYSQAIDLPPRPGYNYPGDCVAIITLPYSCTPQISIVNGAYIYDAIIFDESTGTMTLTYHLSVTGEPYCFTTTHFGSESYYFDVNTGKWHFTTHSSAGDHPDSWLSPNFHQPKGDYERWQDLPEEGCAEPCQTERNHLAGECGFDNYTINEETCEGGCKPEKDVNLSPPVCN